MDIKSLMRKYGVTVGVASGCLVIGTQYGSCTVDPTPPEPQTKEAPAEAEAEKPAEADESVATPASGDGSE